MRPPARALLGLLAVLPACLPAATNDGSGGGGAGGTASGGVSGTGTGGSGARGSSYFDVKFEPDDLLAVIVGPVHADVNRPVIYRLLAEHGYANTRIEVGSVALRTL